MSDLRTSDLRIGDAERERAIAQLERHVGAGRLDLAEFTERSDRVAAARTRSELPRASIVGVSNLRSTGQ